MVGRKKVEINIGNRISMNASKLKWAIYFENSLKIPFAFRWVQFKRIFKYHKYYSSIHTNTHLFYDH